MKDIMDFVKIGIGILIIAIILSIPQIIIAILSFLDPN